MSDTDRAIVFTVNGSRVELRNQLGRPLVDVIRDELKLMGTHVGCRNGDCGACTVLVDGDAFKSCVLPFHRVAGRSIETLDGLAKDDVLHPVQKIFWDSNAFQCGFCLSGNVLCTVGLLRRNPKADRAAIEEALAGNLCRCTGYQQIMEAALAAADDARARHEALQQVSPTETVPDSPRK